MIPVFTICMVIFIVVLKINLNKNSHTQQNIEEQFWEREHQANFTRKQDISNLNYITIPLDKFPLTLNTDEEQALQDLANKRILNLTGISNTDLKLQYGVSNLELLTEYDNNFTLLVNALRTYAKELMDAGLEVDARNVLEFAVSIRADSKHIYLMLANLYRSSNESDKISNLIASAEKLNSISKNSIIHALQALQT